MLAGLAALIVAGVIIGLNSFHTTPSRERATALVATGWMAELFDGRSLRGWQVQSGSWTTGTDDEGGTVISGTDGEILRTLFKSVDGHPVPLPSYRVTVTARLHEANAIELHFNLTEGGTRDTLRVTLDRVAVGHRASKRAPFQPAAAAQPMEIGAERLHEIRVEKGSAWRLFIDDTEVGTLPLTPSVERPEFCLVADGGPAWFGDVFVEELGERQSDNAKPASR